MKIRKYLPKDRSKIIKIINNDLIETFGVPSPNKFEKFGDYEKQGGVFYVMENKGKIIGTIALKNNQTYGELKRMYVIKNYKGKGIADKLFEKLLEFCIKKKMNKMILTTNNKRERAQAFYRKKGFRKIENKNNHSKFMLKIN